jgi:tripartite-type tricarboxylate transporter receptor subunit TctC
VKTIFATMPPAIENIRAGKLRALAVTSATRSDALPDLPTVADFLPGYEATLLSGLSAPRNTPAEVVERINKEVNIALADPGMKTRLAILGNDPVSMTSAEFGKLLADETEKWAKVIHTANLKPE